MEGPVSRRLSDILRGEFDTFSRAQRDVARYIIDHLEEVGYLSAEELGHMGNTSSSTVVRFAQSLGFRGYPELQKAARDEYRLGVTARPTINDDQLGFPIEEDILTRSLQTDALSLRETIKKNDPARFTRAVEAIAEARLVLTVGLHEAAVVAEYAEYIFELLGIPCVSLTGGSEANVARLARIGSEDVLMAVGFRRAHVVTVSFAKKAAASGATVVVITDNALSELADEGRLTLYADIDSTFFVPSLVGPLGLVTALGAAVYTRDHHRHGGGLKIVRDHAAESGRLN
ncbi:MAG: MurR/RpiR family transcriptional regulator [Thermoleophilia bacterium]